MHLLTGLIQAYKTARDKNYRKRTLLLGMMTGAAKAIDAQIIYSNINKVHTSGLGVEVQRFARGPSASVAVSAPAEIVCMTLWYQDICSHSVVLV